MKKILCCLLLALLVVSSAGAETIYESHRVRFEDGFFLTLPADWVSYPITPDLSERGILYCLGSADGARRMYIQRWDAAFHSDAELFAALKERPEIELRSTEDNSASNHFFLYALTEGDASGCAALLEDTVLTFTFVPLSDSENTLIAASIIDSYLPEAKE